MHTTADSEQIPTVDPEKLRQELASSSSRNSRLLAVFLVFLAYMAVTVGATTDLQLLLPESVIRMPILDVELSLFGFYIVAPILVIILHYNILLNLLLHAKKLKAWNVRAAGDKKILLPGFFYNYRVFFEGRTVNSVLLRILLTTVYCFFPLGILLFVQIRFADYHSLPMTLLHYVLVCIDLFVVVCYWYRVAYPGLLKEKYDKFRDMLRTCGERDGLVFALRRILPEIGAQIRRHYSSDKLWALKILSSPLLIPALCFGTLKLFIVRPRSKFHPVYTAAFAVLFLLSFSFLMLVVGIKQEIFKVRYFFVPYLNVSGQSLVSSAPSDFIVGAYISSGRTEEEAWEEFAKGLDLHCRDLRYADMRWTNLFKATLDSARMNYADLSLANLTFAAGYGVELNMAILVGAELSGVKFSWAELNGSVLRHARLNYADLANAQLNGADLEEAKLNGAILWSAELSAARLRESEFDGANLLGANLNGTYIESTDLSGAILRDASCVGDSLCFSSLRGADLSLAKLTGAVLNGTRLAGAIVDSMCIVGAAILRSEDMESAFYTSAPFFRCAPNWEKLLADSVSVPKRLRARGEYVGRIKAAKQRANAIDSIFSGFQPDLPSFVAARAALVCDNSYIAQGMLTPDHVTRELFDSVRQVLLEAVYMNCPSVLDTIVSRSQDQKVQQLIRQFLKRKTDLTHQSSDTD